MTDEQDTPQDAPEQEREGAPPHQAAEETPQQERTDSLPDGAEDAEQLKEERDGELDKTTDPNLPRTQGDDFTDGEPAGPYGGSPPREDV